MRSILKASIACRKTLPVISIVEVKEQLEHEKSHGDAAGGET